MAVNPNHRTRYDAGGSSAAGRIQALGDLLLRYHLPLMSHLQMRLGIDADRAEDLLQGFISSQVLERELLAKADQAMGRFRTFLLTALDRYVANENRAEAARHRAIPSAGAADELHPQASPSSEPDRNFVTDWARELVTEALGRMRRECEAHGRHDVWGVFEARICRPMLEGAAAMPYRELVERFDLVSQAQAANVLITAKRMFVRVLRAVVGEYELDEREIDGEIDELRTILAESGAGSADLG